MQCQNTLGLKQKIAATLLSLLDYTVIKIFLENVALTTANYGAFRIEWVFPYPTQFVDWVLWLGLLALRLKAPEVRLCRIHIYEYLLSAAFALCQLLGQSFFETNSFTLITANRYSLLLAVFSLLALTLLFVNLLRWIKYAAVCLLKSEIKLPKLWDKHPFLFPFIIIVALWMPLEILKYPGGIDFDSYWQLLEGFGYQELEDANPIASTMFFTYSVKLGWAVFGTANRGLFFAEILYMLVCAFCLAYAVKALHSLRVKNQMLLLCLALFSVFTIFSRYTTSLNKDGIYSALTLLVLAIVAELMYDKVTGGRLAGLAIAAVLMGIMRANGFYILLIFALVLLLCSLVKKNKLWLRISSAALCACLVCAVYMYGFIPSLNLPNRGISEMLSVPLMQTARYLRDNPDGVTEEEREIINAVHDCQSMLDNYNEKISDELKGDWHGEGEDTKEYFKVWAKHFLRRPDIYFAATFNNVYGYFCPGVGEEKMGLSLQYDPVSFVSTRLFMQPEEEYALRSDRMDALSAFIKAFESFPLFYLFSSVALSFWATIYLAFTAIRRRRATLLLIMIPSIVCMLGCIGVPTFFHNGLRYGLPVIFANPFILSLFVHEGIIGSVEKDAQK